MLSGVCPNVDHYSDNLNKRDRTLPILTNEHTEWGQTHRVSTQSLLAAVRAIFTVIIYLQESGTVLVSIRWS